MIETQVTKTPIILTTGIYDLLKELIRKKKLNKSNEDKLENELKNCRQVLSRDLPTDVVTVNTLVRVKDIATGEEIEQRFVSPQKARLKHGTTSILSPIGVATLGYATGAVIEWELPEGLRSLKIIKVEKFP
jgi:regulator of nucleoside diphosphate kinase